VDQTITLTATTESQKNALRIAERDNEKIAYVIKEALSNWYAYNKDRLNINDAKNMDVMQLTLRVDEETWNLYKLYISDTIDRLLNDLN